MWLSCTTSIERCWRRADSEDTRIGCTKEPAEDMAPDAMGPAPLPDIPEVRMPELVLRVGRGKGKRMTIEDERQIKAHIKIVEMRIREKETTGARVTPTAKASEDLDAEQYAVSKAGYLPFGHTSTLLSTGG